MTYLFYKRSGEGKGRSAWIVASLLWVLMMGAACTKSITVPAPTTSTNADNVYTSDANAAAVLTGIYTNLVNGGVAGTQLMGISVYAGLSADEFTLFNVTGNISYSNYYHNVSDNRGAGATSDFWSNAYQFIYVTNAAVIGLTDNKVLTPAVEQQLMGEAKFMRAFCYFYLVNLYGDVPLTTSTDYTVNAKLSRSPKADVYQQIIADLTDAKALLSDQYLDGTVLNTSSDRVRPTKWAASALLARAYLYNGDWANAAMEASLVINSGNYSLAALNDAFLATSPEAIWQLQPVGYGMNTAEAVAFIIPSTGIGSNNAITLSDGLLKSFEPGDQRRANWVGSLTDNSNTTHYYAYKYKVNAFGAPVTEYEMVFRLGEQYLIRAEAEAQQDNTAGAAADLDSIRHRAGLPKTTASTKTTLLAAIQRERRVELFSEWGHRWLDLKRTGAVDSVMTIATPVKGGTWDTRHQLYPISNYELTNDPNLKQNPGY